ncbi:hypothetical protein B0G52_1404 [Cohnella sp. SGD-V74]|jgi:hypothetical protein|uniref:hypothetical protein n=1 Tax=unclassified Cohnella TaxID=2636738 RepID=UPI000D439194|nr:MULTISPECIES: hypothetical protein [unclassified Cohnella]PRX55740.1 hypothetical protein B0G52_1404 [Cohnella sp. SGD-V74]
MNRKEIAHETVRIMEQGGYEYSGRRIDFSAQQKRSEETSVLISPRVVRGDSIRRVGRSRRQMHTRFREGICVKLF